MVAALDGITWQAPERWQSAPQVPILLGIFNLAVVLLVVGLWNPVKLGGALRFLCAIVALGTAAYLGVELLHPPGDLYPASRVEAHPLNAIGAVLVIGVRLLRIEGSIPKPRWHRS